jgi:PII-like signaling protein
MNGPVEGHLLRIFINESDRLDGRPLYEAIVRSARDAGLAGATALRGVEGFGARNRIHSVRVLHLSEDVPIVVEILDRPEAIAQFLPRLDRMIGGGVITLEKVNMVVYQRDAEPETQLDDEIQLESSAETGAADKSTMFVEAAGDAHPIITAAKESAAGSRRVYFDSVDLLLAMLCESKGIATRALNNLGIDCRQVARSLRESVSRDENPAQYQKSLERKSVAAAKWLEHGDLGTEHYLLALCQIRPSAATDVLTRLGAAPRDICKEVLDILGRDGDWQGWLASHPDM